MNTLKTNSVFDTNFVRSLEFLKTFEALFSVRLRKFICMNLTSCCVYLMLNFYLKCSLFGFLFVFKNLGAIALSWWLSWKNAAESFTVALTLTLGGYESAIAPKSLLCSHDTRCIDGRNYGVRVRSTSSISTLGLFGKLKVQFKYLWLNSNRPCKCNPTIPTRAVFDIASALQ